jgi:hypothetical protein
LHRILTVSSDDSQRKRSDSEDLVAEHGDGGNVIAGGDELSRAELKYIEVELMQLQR